MSLYFKNSLEVTLRHSQAARAKGACWDWCPGLLAGELLSGAFAATAGSTVSWYTVTLHQPNPRGLYFTVHSNFVPL